MAGRAGEDQVSCLTDEETEAPKDPGVCEACFPIPFLSLQGQRVSSGLHGQDFHGD